MHAIRISSTGGPEVLEWAEVPTPEPDPAGLVVRLAAAGVNFIDTYHRVGIYPVEMPYVLGMEGAGTVEAVGANVTEWSVGDQVAWTGVPSSYAEYVAVPADRAVAVPEGVAVDLAAAAMLQGLTAHYLCHDTFPLHEGQQCLVHAGAGGVGLLLIQMAKRLGATVFATVGNEEKAKLATDAGADHVILYTEQDFGEAVEEIAGTRPLDVVYDGVGASTFDRGLDLLRRRGTMVLFGQSSGVVPPFDLGSLARMGSLYVTRPMLFDYIPTPEELRSRAGELLGWIADGSLQVRVGARFALRDAAEAHRALEGRLTTGKVLLEP